MRVVDNALAAPGGSREWRLLVSVGAISDPTLEGNVAGCQRLCTAESRKTRAICLPCSLLTAPHPNQSGGSKLLSVLSVAS